MTCNEIATLLELLLDDQLDPDARVQALQHMAACSSCQSHWDEMKKVRGRLEEFKVAIPVSDSLQQQVKDRLAAASTDEKKEAASAPEKERHLQIIPTLENLKSEPKQVGGLSAMVQERLYQQEALKDGTTNTSKQFSLRPRTVICEKHELIRFGLKRVISEVVEVVGEASDGMMATEMIRRLKPDFVILDVDLEVLNGVEVCRRISQELPAANILILTDSYHATKYHGQLQRSGARGFCLKSSGPRSLFEAIDQVTHSLPYCDPKITQLVKQTAAASIAPNSNLTDRETEVLIRLDLRNKEIAEELDMKLRTVEKHIECILAKLKVPTRTAAALKAVQLGLVLLPKMPGRDPITGVTHEQTVNELQAELAIANEHLKALFKQNSLLKEALDDKLRRPSEGS